MRCSISRKIYSFKKGINQKYGFTKDMSLCMSLPDEAWENPGLISECPNCHTLLKFNPFIVDNKEE